MVSAASGIFDDLFAPVPEASIRRKKVLFDHVADYADSAAGAWDVFSVIDRCLANLKMLPSLPNKSHVFIGRVSNAINTIGIGLSIPAIFSDSNTLRHSVIRLLHVKDLSDDDPLKTRKVAQAAKACFLDTMAFVNDASQASLFIDHVKIIAFNAVQLRFLDGAYYITSAIGDSFELVEECYKLNRYESLAILTHDQTEVEQLKEKKWLSWLIIAKDVSSVAISVIAIVGLLFAASELPFIAVTWAILSTFWLSMKLICYFYQKTVVEPHSTALLSPSVR